MRVHLYSRSNDIFLYNKNNNKRKSVKRRFTLDNLDALLHVLTTKDTKEVSNYKLLWSPVVFFFKVQLVIIITIVLSNGTIITYLRPFVPLSYHIELFSVCVLWEKNLTKQQWFGYFLLVCLYAHGCHLHNIRKVQAVMMMMRKFTTLLKFVCNHKWLTNNKNIVKKSYWPFLKWWTHTQEIYNWKWN